MAPKGIIKSENIKLEYLCSGISNHMFKLEHDKKSGYAIKVRTFPKDDYGEINDQGRPENVEFKILKLLSKMNEIPHFISPNYLFNTNIKNFINIANGIIDINDGKNEIYRNFLNNQNHYDKNVSILICQWCNGGNLLDYIRKKYKEMTLEDWTVIIFQVLFTLAFIHQKYPSFRHNDFKANNILINVTDVKEDKSHQEYIYNMDNVKFTIPNINLGIKIWDFDFTSIDGIIENNKVNSKWTEAIGITKKQNRYYDMHYFFNTLTSKRFFPQFYENGAPKEIIDFVHRIIPEEYRHQSSNISTKGRILVDTEYTTPYKVIIEDPLFKKYQI
jgi:hypothetical protein